MKWTIKDTIFSVAMVAMVGVSKPGNRSESRCVDMLSIVQRFTKGWHNIPEVRTVEIFSIFQHFARGLVQHCRI